MALLARGNARQQAITRDEAFRVLRSTVLVALSDLRNPIVVVTGTIPDEGKTSTCASLARSLASAGSRVVLVDLDLRNSNAHTVLGLHNDVGVSDVLSGKVPVEDALQFLDLGSDRGMYFLAAGRAVGTPPSCRLRTRRPTSSMHSPHRPTSCCLTRHLCSR